MKARKPRAKRKPTVQNRRDLLAVGPKLVDAFGRDKRAQDAHALPVLAGAFELLCAGWCADFSLEKWGNTPIPEHLWDLIGALGESCQCSTGIDVVYARRLLQKFEFNLLHWEQHPRRTQEDVLRLVQRAIVLGGGDPPAIPRPEPVRRRGGWAISSEVPT